MDKGLGKDPAGRKSETVVYSKLDYVALVDMVRKSKSAKKREMAFSEIERRMQSKIKQFSYRFNIPGLERSDIYQESLVALRFKAIKDYNPARGNGNGPYPFEKFARICIVRHLSTKLKASFQNRKKPWIGMVSLSQAKPDSNDSDLFLADIIPQLRTEGNILEDICENEHSRNLFRQLFEGLSEFEQTVFKMYLQRKSYEQIADEVIENHRSKKKANKVKIIKSVDNALSRIKNKGREIKGKLEQK